MSPHQPPRAAPLRVPRHCSGDENFSNAWLNIASISFGRARCCRPHVTNPTSANVALSVSEIRASTRVLSVGDEPSPPQGDMLTGGNLVGAGGASAGSSPCSGGGGDPALGAAGARRGCGTHFLQLLPDCARALSPAVYADDLLLPAVCHHAAAQL